MIIEKCIQELENLLELVKIIKINISIYKIQVFITQNCNNID